MCAGAVINARIKKVYIGTKDPKTGACGSVLNLFEDYKFNHKVECKTGIMRKRMRRNLKGVFQRIKKYEKV